MALPAQPEIVTAANRRGVTEIVHFTTVQGAVGICATRAVKSRRLLPEDNYLEHVYRPNALDRSRDSAWHDYVNLSVSRINDWMFGASRRWHVTEGVSWVLLSFITKLLGDPGVVFTTTNNAYAGVTRAEGLEGFEQMFADRVIGSYYGTVQRSPGHPSSFPTHRQAEVLYPFELPISYLQKIYVQTEEGLDNVEGALGATDTDVPAQLAPEVFR
ncbi:MAG: DarT ssDNA thymidine ADP-ribosyltransferase family protein [Gaiellales bacterium]